MCGCVCVNCIAMIYLRGLMSIIMKIIVQDVTPCRLVDMHKFQLFRRTLQFEANSKQNYILRSALAYIYIF
jgi:hypothetical protein